MSNISITGVPEEEKGVKGTEAIFREIMAENVPKLVKYINP